MEIRSADTRREVYAALDLGTNNCRLLIACAEPGGFRVIDAFSRIVRLGEGIGDGGDLSREAIDRTLAALRICMSKIRRNRVTHLRAVATEVCRRAGNSAAFIERVRKEIGLELDVITTREEAQLALDGCSPLLDPENGHALVFDIGGGSTELMFLRQDAGGATLKAWLSLPHGVVTLSERFGGYAIDAEAYRAMQEEIMPVLRAFEAEHEVAATLGDGGLQVLGTSGTVTTLAGIHLDLARYDRSRVDGLWIDFPTIIGICRRLATSDYELRRRHPCIGRERADLVVAGCAILEAMHRLWPAKRLRVADRGVREGILFELMRNGAVPTV
ncbi:Ppx/GppA phosphatase family protein [Oceanibacterium hippocampi]|uniref:Ppx/GppA phosphatase family protein n=1 Tax=Oceanibacterium hippocampi TaxID=745714 RepID=UPI001C391405|nr:Ppx/GppA phosphatase family protein [Oceanibacterium hippocampi]